MTLTKEVLTTEMLDKAVNALNTESLHGGVDTEAVGLAVRESIQANVLLIREYAAAIAGEQSIESAFKVSLSAGILIGWRLREEAGATESLEKLFDKSAN